MRFVRRFWPPVLLALIVTLGTFFWFKHEEILDWAAMRGYEPPELVEKLAEDTAMTSYAKRLFYVNRPAVQDKQDFNQSCTDPSEQVAVLGCFLGNRMGIYIYDVTDKRLDGIEEVTAAHEMLHQAYQRLGEADKTRINGLLQEYHDLRASKKLKNKIASYEHHEPDQLLNEMHSIFGTEAADLPDELEKHYEQYFENRKKVLALYQRYQSEFDKRIARINQLDERLEELRVQIETNKQTIAAREQQLSNRRNQLDAYLAANRVRTYNAAVPGFNAMVAEYRNLINETNSMVDEFNDILAERNELAVQERQLEEAIDSSVDAATSQ